MLKKLSVAGSLILAVFAGKAAFAGNERLLRGRCHQGECSFTKVVSTQTVGKNDAGYMLLIKERSAIVNLSAKDPDPEKVKPPKYFGLVKVSFAFCSTQRPAIIFYSDGKFYAHVLNIGESASDFAVRSHVEYWAVCHEKVVSVSDVMSDALAKEARDLGYKKVPEAEKVRYSFRTRAKAFRFFGL
jgi:hypothetical protein